MSQGIHLRKYGVEATIEFELYEVDGVNLRADWTPAQSDCEIEKDEGGYTICDNTASGTTTYKIVLTATEMQFARGALKIVDSATKAFLDKVVYIETYGNASAQHAFDLDTALQTVDLTHIMNTILTEGAGGRLAAAFIKLLDVATPTLVASDVMRGTNAAALASICTEIRLAELDAANIPLDLLAMRGATFDTATDSLEALRNRGDAAWTTGSGSSTINAQGNVGDYKEDATVAIKWDTKGVAPTSPGEIRIYFNGGTNEITVPTGVTDTRAFDGLTGVNHLSIDLSANDNYRKERDFAAVLVGMVIGGQTVNVVLGTWSVEKRNQGEGFRKDS